MIQGLHIWTVNGTGAQSNGEVLLGGEHAEVTASLEVDEGCAF